MKKQLVVLSFLVFFVSGLGFASVASNLGQSVKTEQKDKKCKKKACCKDKAAKKSCSSKAKKSCCKDKAAKKSCSSKAKKSCCSSKK